MRIHQPLQAALTALLLLICFASHAQAPGGDAGATQIKLDEDVLSRLEAAQADIEAHGGVEAFAEDDDHQTGSSTMPETIERVGASIDADPKKHALVDRHGFTGRSFIRAHLTLLQAKYAALMGEAGQKSDIARHNAKFYKAHEARIKQLMGQPDDRSQADIDKTEESAKRFGEMDPDVREDCHMIAAGMLPLVPLGAPGSAEVDNQHLRKVAASLTETAGRLNHDSLREQMNTMADVLRNDPGHAPLKSPRFKAAVEQLKAWSDENC
ncbi:hypothetical protein C84B14_05576 [Salinisphaera sp. C84B14]|uniref:hypothetical protein n=1 Tax=Salinisphaera sp. C84B14 TaxID=1304155 RepID=UPI00334250DF